ncbi:unnamed protein product [Lota lota]
MTMDWLRGVYLAGLFMVPLISGVHSISKGNTTDDEVPASEVTSSESTAADTGPSTLLSTVPANASTVPAIVSTVPANASTTQSPSLTARGNGSARQETTLPTTTFINPQQPSSTAGPARPVSIVTPTIIGYVFLVIIVISLAVLCWLIIYLKKKSRWYSFDFKYPVLLMDPPGTFETINMDELTPPPSVGRVLAVEWTRVDVSPAATLMVFREGRALVKERGRAYDGRTSMDGDGRSLRLANVGRHDNGTYRCYVHFEGLRDGREGLVQLKIVVVSRPLITLTKTQSRELLLGCEARDWFPEPEVSWQDGEGGMLPSDPPETQRNRSHDFYNVRTNLHITAVKRMSNVLLCRATVQNISLTQQIQLGGNWESAVSDWTYLHIVLCFLCVAIGCGLHLLLSRHRVTFNTVIMRLTYKLRRFRQDPDYVLGVEDRYSAYGNIREVDTTGASEAYARENGLDVRGVNASQVFARRDHGEMLKYRQIILNVADRHAIHPGLIAAIISRQSRAGVHLQPTGYGVFDCTCYGLMQLNEAYHPLKPDPYGEDHIDQGTMILIQAIKSIKRAKDNYWNKNQILKGGLAAYITDAHHVGDQYEEVDASTPYGDFSNDVVARAQWYADNGFA